MPRAAQAQSGTPVTCADFRTGTGLEVFAERVTASGQVHAEWTPDPARLCAGTAHEYSFNLVSDGAGGALVAWVQSGADGADLFLQHLGADGSVAPGWPVGGLALCTAAHDQYGPWLAADGAGGAWVVWEDYRSGRGAIFASHVSGSGERLQGIPPDGIAVCDAALDQSGAAVFSDGSGGGVIVVWQQRAVGPARLRAQRLAPDGARAWAEAGVALTAGDAAQSSPVLASDGAGGALVVWEERREGGVPRLHATRITTGGAIAAGWPGEGLALCAAAGAQRHAVVAADGAGGAVVAWYDLRAGSGDIYAQRVTAEGAIAAGWPADGVAVCDDPGEQYGPAMLPDGAGGAFVAWEDYRGGEDGDIYATRVTAQGALAAGWPTQGVVLCATPEAQSSPALASDGEGGAIATWNDARSAGLAVFQSVAWSSGPQPALVSAEASLERVRLTWHVPAGSAFQATVMRSGEGAELAPVGEVAADAQGMLRYEDREVKPGARYRYRLARVREEALELLAEAVVEIPWPAALALLAARPNPAPGVLRVALVLPSAQRAVLELLDVGGRRLASREVGALGPGAHVVELAEGGRLAPGVYLVRLTQGRASRTLRATVIR